MSHYLYQENRVFIPSQAEVLRPFMPGIGVMSEVVQDALNEVRPWKKGEDPIHDFYVPNAIGSLVVELEDSETPGWAINPRHRAKRPGLSPYVELEKDDPRATTTVATIELKGTPHRPILVRAYPGEYMPPLPWMKSVTNTPDGGKEASLNFWMRHAFVHTRPDLTLSEEAPDWYKQAQ